MNLKKRTHSDGQLDGNEKEEEESRMNMFLLKEGTKKRQVESPKRREGIEKVGCGKRRRVDYEDSIKMTKKTIRSCLKLRSSLKGYIIEKKSRSRRVVFAPNCKTHDGLLPAHQLLDLCTWAFFGCVRMSMTAKELFHMAWRHGYADQLDAVRKLLIDLQRRIQEVGYDEDVPVLPRGGGRLVQLNASHLVTIGALINVVADATTLMTVLREREGSDALAPSRAPPALPQPQYRGFGVSSSFLSEYDRDADVPATLNMAEYDDSNEYVPPDEMKAKASGCVFSLPAVISDSTEEDEWDLSDEAVVNGRKCGGSVVVDGVKLSKHDIERMEERLAKIEDEHDSGEIGFAEYLNAKKHLTCVLDAVRCAAS